jgi:hypothetical protein
MMKGRGTLLTTTKNCLDHSTTHSFGNTWLTFISWVECQLVIPRKDNLNVDSATGLVKTTTFSRDEPDAGGGACPPPGEWVNPANKKTLCAASRETVVNYFKQPAESVSYYTGLFYDVS